MSSFEDESEDWTRHDLEWTGNESLSLDILSRRYPIMADLYAIVVDPHEKGMPREYVSSKRYGYGLSWHGLCAMYQFVIHLRRVGGSLLEDHSMVYLESLLRRFRLGKTSSSDLESNRFRSLANAIEALVATIERNLGPDSGFLERNVDLLFQTAIGALESGFVVQDARATGDGFNLVPGDSEVVSVRHVLSDFVNYPNETSIIRTMKLLAFIKNKNFRAQLLPEDLDERGVSGVSTPIRRQLDRLVELDGEVPMEWIVPILFPDS